MNTERYKKSRITNVRNRFLYDLYGSRSLFLLSVICLLFCYPEVSARDREAAEHTISAGVARVNITSSVPVVMAGYGSRTQPFEGINDSLYAVATVFDDGRTRAAIIMVEVLTFPHSSWEEITTLIEIETGIPRDHILLVPTHTHGAPSTRVSEDSDSNPVGRYIGRGVHRDRDEGERAFPIQEYMGYNSL